MKGNLVIKPVSLAIALSFIGSAGAVGNGTIVSGSGNISKNNNQTTVKQDTDKMIVNWNNMDVGKNERLTFNQKNQNSSVLNKINGIDPTVIQGALNANGKVFIVNQNGVLISKGATINVGSLVASSLDIKNDDFNNGNLHFTGNEDGKVINQGDINAANSVALIGAGQVENNGKINTKQGDVNLAAGKDITLSFPSLGRMNVRVNAGSLNALVKNGGIVVAKGGNIMLTAWATDQLTRGVINNTGVLEASNVNYQNDGSVLLISYGNTNSTIDVGGKIKSGVMGEIYVEGQNTNVGADLTAKNAGIKIISRKKDGYVNVDKSTFDGDVIIQSDNVLTTENGRNSTFSKEVRVNNVTRGNNYELADKSTNKNNIKAGHGSISEGFVDAVVNSKSKLIVTNYGGDINANNKSHNYGDLYLSTTDGDVNINGDMSGNNMYVDSRGGVNQSSGAKINMKEDVNLHSWKDISMGDDITAGRSLTLATEKNFIQKTGAKASAEDISLYGKNITLDGDVSSRNVTVNLTGNLTQGKTSSINTDNLKLGGSGYTSYADYDLMAGHNNIKSISGNAGSLRLSNESDIELKSGARFSNDLVIKGDKNVKADKTSVGGVADIQAGGDFIVSNGLSVDGSLTVQANNIIESQDSHPAYGGDSISVEGDANLTAKNNLTLNSVQTGGYRNGNLTLNGKNVDVKFKNAKGDVIVNGVVQPKSGKPGGSGQHDGYNDWGWGNSGSGHSGGYNDPWGDGSDNIFAPPKRGGW